MLRTLITDPQQYYAAILRCYAQYAQRVYMLCIATQVSVAMHNM
jgi:hypothetical protein